MTSSIAAIRTLQVGVKAVIRDSQGKILVLRKDRPFEGQQELKWEIPGGRINVGETTSDALKRETKEETGLDLVRVHRILAVQDILINPKLHVVRITFEVEATGKVILNHSDDSDTTHDDVAWLTPAELMQRPLDHYLAEILPMVS